MHLHLPVTVFLLTKVYVFLNKGKVVFCTFIKKERDCERGYDEVYFNLNLKQTED